MIRHLCVMNVHDDRKIELYNRLCYNISIRYMTWHQDRSKSQLKRIAILHLLCMCDLTFSLEKVRSSMISRYCQILVNHVNWNGKRHPWVNLLDLALALASSSSGTSWRRFFLTGSATWPSAGSDEPATASVSASFAARVAALSRALWAEADTMPPKIVRCPWVKGAKQRLQFEWSFLNSMYQWLGLLLESLGFAYGVQYVIHKSSINKASIFLLYRFTNGKVKDPLKQIQHRMYVDQFNLELVPTF